ncbi:DCC1-like thiol-disulfide oxidoreductase family protein [Nocardioides sp.]|uniref:DCC1-like thiol-disulfide oxidoreductase family protein n=1 Tax=Nocardioides sp. TaxID=35761 RepID=UPI003D0DEED2
MRLTVLYDEDCAMCRGFGTWLANQPLLVPIDLVAAGSTQARNRFPGLDHRRTLEEITVVGDDGAVWTNEHAWVMCLWATTQHRALAERLARPAWLPLAKAAAYTAAGIRSRTRSSVGGDYIDDCAGTCSPLSQG